MDDARLGLLEALDPFAPLRGGLREAAEVCEHWAGIPMPLEDARLVIEPSYPDAEGLASITHPAPRPLEEDGVRLRNTWICTARGTRIYIWEEDGRIHWGAEPAVHSLATAIRTIGCSAAWGIEQEAAAVQLLGSLVNHAQMKAYLLTGMFTERSRRSGVFYLFRRLRPTVAIAAAPDGVSTRILCTLCLHPIAFYEGSWAGAMAPTDDVVAHLMLMRGDEAMLWRRANQHAAGSPEAGL